MAWSMRYSFHAGYAPPAFASQFRATLGGDDPVALVRFAAVHGMAGVLYPWALDRPPAEVERVAAALAETGLAGGCLVIATPPFAWTDRSPGGGATLTAAVERACTVAAALGATIVVAFPLLDPARADAPAAQRDDLVANLTAMATVAGRHGMTIGLEPMHVPHLGLALQSLDDALDVVDRAGGGVGIIFDTAHVATMHGDLLDRFRAAYDRIVLIQLADLPGRVEPGAGTLDLVPLAAEAIARGYVGLVDLEHGWLTPNAQGESDGLTRLRTFDDRVRAAVAAGLQTGDGNVAHADR